MDITGRVRRARAGKTLRKTLRKTSSSIAVCLLYLKIGYHSCPFHPTQHARREPSRCRLEMVVVMLLEPVNQGKLLLRLNCIARNDGGNRPIRLNSGGGMLSPTPGHLGHELILCEGWLSDREDVGQMVREVRGLSDRRKIVLTPPLDVFSH